MWKPNWMRSQNRIGLEWLPFVVSFGYLKFDGSILMNVVRRLGMAKDTRMYISLNNMPALVLVGRVGLVRRIGQPKV